MEREGRDVQGVTELCCRDQVHLELCHLNPFCTFDIVGFRRPHVKSVIEQSILV